MTELHRLVEGVLPVWASGSGCGSGSGYGFGFGYSSVSGSGYGYGYGYGYGDGDGSGSGDGDGDGDGSKGDWPAAGATILEDGMTPAQEIAPGEALRATQEPATREDAQ